MTKASPGSGRRHRSRGRTRAVGRSDRSGPAVRSGDRVVGTVRRMVGRPARSGLAALLALPGLLAVPPSAVGQPSPAAVLAEVGAVLRAEADLRRVDYRVDGTEVTLSGEAPTLRVKTRAIDRVLEIEGVDTVASELVIPGGEDDDALAEAVGAAIQGYRHYTIWDYVGGSVVDGVVTLSGSVTPDRDKPGELFERIAVIPGIQDIVNELFVQSASRRDRDLRQLIAGRVRRHPVFAQYLLLSHSPFRILVHEGEVLLVGTVRSGVESRVIEQIARQAFETEQVINRLQVGGG